MTGVLDLNLMGLAVRDLNKRLNVSIPVSEAYTTVAGFLMSESGQILNEGDIVPYNGHSFEVEKVEKRRVLSVRMHKTPALDDAETVA